MRAPVIPGLSNVSVGMEIVGIFGGIAKGIDYRATIKRKTERAVVLMRELDDEDVKLLLQYAKETGNAAFLQAFLELKRSIITHKFEIAKMTAEA